MLTCTKIIISTNIYAKKKEISAPKYTSPQISNFKRQFYLISTRLSSISTGLWKCITYFDQAVCLLHFSHNMATISSNIKTSCLPHVFAIYLFLSLHLPKMFLQAWNYCIFFYSNLQEVKKEPGLHYSTKVVVWNWMQVHKNVASNISTLLNDYEMFLPKVHLYIYYSRFFVKINDDLDNVIWDVSSSLKVSWLMDFSPKYASWSL